MDSDAWFRGLVESIPSVVYECALDGSLRFCSRSLADLTGHAAAEVLEGSPALEELIVPEDRERVAAARGAVVEPGEQISLEYRMQHRAGNILWVHDRAAARAAGDELVLVGCIVDACREKRRESEALARTRLVTLGELAAGIAHEVNNPLSGVLNYAQLAERLVPEDQTKLREALAGIVAEGRRIQDLTQLLLTFARRPDDDSFRPLSAQELVRAALTVMRRQLREEFVTLSVEVPSELPALQARGQELQQVVQNLLVNARQALKARYPHRDANKQLTVTAAHHVEADDDLGMIEIVITDTGIGIEPEVMERLFEPFFTTHTDGVGLGLSVAREVVERHRGRLEVESQPGAGATFRLWVPVYGA